MDRLEAYTRTITVACEDLEFWLERPRGYPLLVVKNLHENGTTAYPQGLRNGDIVVAINDRRAWELNIGEALLLLLGPIGENAHGTVDVTWMPRAQSAFALRIVHEIREEGQRRSGGLPADPTRSTGGGAESSIEVHRRRNIHEVMSPAQVERHRQRNVRANMSQEQAERHRQLNSQDQMTPEQIERQRGRNRHTNMTNDQIANHQRRANLLILPRDGALQLNYGTRCPHCGFRYLQHETNKDLCCGRGKATRVPFPELNPLPANIRRLATNYPQHFAEQSFQYNNLLAFAAIGVDNGDPSSSGFRRPAGGPHCIKIHGRTYHRVATASGQRNAVRYFVHDAFEELHRHGLERKLNAEFLRLIHEDLLAINPLARELRQLGRELAAHDRAQPQGIPGMQTPSQPTALRLTTSTSRREIGAVIVHAETHCNETARPSIMIHVNDTEDVQYIRGDDPLREPLAYPLLFPHGDLGWGRGRTYSCEHAEYLRYRLLMPEPGLEMQTQSSQRCCVNRFQLLTRIAQVYLVDTISRIEDNRLSYIRSHQATFVGDDGDDMTEDGNEQGERPRRFFLPSSYTGSNRHLKKLAANALALVGGRGKPTIFITLTCNPRWPEIVRELLRGQTAFDRPDVTCRVFHTKLQLVLKLIRQGEIFGTGHPVEYELRVIEFQFRGLPHAHVVMRLGGLADGDSTSAVRWIDEHISASIPCITPQSTNEDIAYIQLATSHMVHVCSRGQNGCLNEFGTCQKGFPKPLTNSTHFEERGYPVYRRTTPQDSKVVPHNRLLLTLWDGHVNVEFAGHVLLVLYLYKYIFKGPDKARVQIIEGAAEDDQDEITRYVRARYLSSMECMWTTLRYQVYPATSPPVKCVVVQLPSQLPPGRQVSDMLRYLERPQALHHLRYTEMFTRFNVGQQLPRYAQAAGYEYYTCHIKRQLHYYFRRRDHDAVVCRMNTIYITAGEVWYLRLILLNRAVTSYEDAKTVRGQAYSTYQEAAKAAGYATDENEAYLCFMSSVAESTPSQLRGLFILLTREGYPTVRIYRDDECRTAMMADFIQQEDSSALATNKLLEDLAERLQENFRVLSDYGLPEPRNLATELSKERMRYDPAEQRAWIEQQPLPSQDQGSVVEAVFGALERQERLLLFVQGKGGTGKTWLMKRLIAEVRSRRGLALVCAATGLAATLYAGGTTAHSLFRIPVEEDAAEKQEDETLNCKLHEGSQRLELLRAAHLIVWDEFPNNHRHSFEAVYRAMRGFKGQVLVACGDFRQIPPVVPGGDKWQVIDASMRSSHLWRLFRVMELTVSHRHARDPEYSAFVQHIGEGAVGERLTDPDAEIGAVPNAKVVPLGFLQSFNRQTLQAAIQFVYPDLLNVSALSDRAVLAPTNELVDEWNATIQNMSCEQQASAEGASREAGKMYCLHSADVLTECDDERGHIRRMLTTEFLNSLNRPGVPPHQLQLAVGDICIVVRNLNKKDGLTNNRRVLVLAIQPFAVRVQTVGCNPKVFTLPRIRFKFRLPQGSFEVMRTQFPLRLAYCMTYNKAQGQELRAVLVDLRIPAFTHGHLYVALSRVRQRENIAAFISDEDAADTSIPVTLNIVYPELLDR